MRRTATRHRAAIGLVALGLAACQGEAATRAQVIVFVEAEPETARLAHDLQLTVEYLGETREVVLDETVAKTFPLKLALVPKNGDANRIYRVTVQAQDASGTTLTEARLLSGYVRGQKRYVKLWLEDSCLRGTRCAADKSCHAGQCVPAMIDPMQLGLSGDQPPRAGDLYTPATDGSVPPAAGSDAPRDAGGRGGQSGANGQSGRGGSMDAGADGGATGAGGGGSGAGTGGEGGDDGMGGNDGGGGSGGIGGSGSAGTSGSGGSGGSSGTGAVRSGGFSDSPIEYDDPALSCQSFRAHAMGSTLPYSLDTMPDRRIVFTFAASWQGVRYARSFRPTVDGAHVVAMYLYKLNVTVADGQVSSSNGVHGGAELLQLWSPGGTDLFFDPDVGMEMPSTTGYQLEIHYKNTTGATVEDSSGFQVCATPSQPTFMVGRTWLGTDAINGAEATGICEPSSALPVQIIGGTPHMRAKGTHMKVVINRAAGGTETIHDAVFVPTAQRTVSANAVWNVGDTITTTCTYDSSVTFGYSADQEVCYFVALQRPRLGLSNDNSTAALIHGADVCLP